MKTWKILIIPAVVLASVIFFRVQTGWLQTSEFVISSPKVPEAFDGFKILQLSDLHSARFGDNNNALLRRIDAAKPDIIVMTGDMLNSQRDRGEVILDLVSRLTGAYPVYYISGNHEQIAAFLARQEGLDWYDRFVHELQNRGAQLLDNRRVELEAKGARINLCGLLIPLPFYKGKNVASYEGEARFSPEHIVEALGSLNREEFNILMAHNPAHFAEYAAWGADLVLAGHTHGGIIRIPFLKGLLSPEIAFFPEYDAGMFTMEQSTMVVSRGLGSVPLGIRVFNCPELCLIKLQSAKEGGS